MSYLLRWPEMQLTCVLWNSTSVLFCCCACFCVQCASYKMCVYVQYYVVWRLGFLFLVSSKLVR